MVVMCGMRQKSIVEVCGLKLTSPSFRLACRNHKVVLRNKRSCLRMRVTPCDFHFTIKEVVLIKLAGVHTETYQNTAICTGTHLYMLAHTLQAHSHPVCTGEGEEETAWTSGEQGLTSHLPLLSSQSPILATAHSPHVPSRSHFTPHSSSSHPSLSPHPPQGADPAAGV